jgi:replicative DNA helicase
LSEPLFDRIPPHNLEAERALLGSCLLEREALLLATESLAPEDFYDPHHRTAFELISDMARKDRAVDPVTFWEEGTKRGVLERLGGQPFVAALIDAVATTANAEAYARIVRDKSIHRRLVAAGNQILRLGYAEDRELEDVLDEAERLVFEIASTGASGSVRHVSEVLGVTFEQIERRFHEGQIVTGVSTGFIDFDRLTGGFQPGSLNIIAARPSMGKTAFALNIAQHAAQEKGVPVLLFSLEMGAEQLAQRLLGAEARVNIHDLRTGNFPEKAWDSLADAAGRLSQSPIYIDDSSLLTTSDLRARVRRFQARQKDKLGMVVVDYLQLMSWSRRTDSKQQEVSEISRALKGVAREFEIPVVALSQLSRAVESRPDKRPQLSDLRDSGAIEQDADLVCLLFRPGYYEPKGSGQENNPEAEVIVAKHRNGPTGKVDLIFLQEFARFAGRDRVM